MRNFFYRIFCTYQRFMQGRYGVDEFSGVMFVVAFILTAISNLLRVSILYFIGMAIFIYSLYRCISKNIYKRQSERNKYYEIKLKLTDIYKSRRNMWVQRKTHKFFKCPNCKVTIRVPRGVGKIEITCPKCKTKIIRKTGK